MSKNRLIGAMPFALIKAKKLRVDDRVAFCDETGIAFMRTVRLVENVGWFGWIRVGFNDSASPYSGLSEYEYTRNHKLLVAPRSRR